MHTMNIAAGAASDEQKIMRALEQLPPEYVRKVCIFADTLLSIFTNKR